MTPTNRPEHREEWVPIKGFADYEVSSFGRIKSYKAKVPKILNPCKNSDGYPMVTFNGRKEKVHRLVAISFGIIEESDWVNHIDGVKDNNKLSNLEKSNCSHNAYHAFRIGLRTPNKVFKLNKKQCVDIIKRYSEGEFTRSIAKRHNITNAWVSAIALGRTRKDLDMYRKKFQLKPRGRNGRLPNE